MQEKVIAEGKIVARRMVALALTEATQAEKHVNKKENYPTSKESINIYTYSFEQCIQGEFTWYFLLSCLEIKSNPLEW